MVGIFLHQILSFDEVSIFCKTKSNLNLFLCLYVFNKQMKSWRKNILYMSEFLIFQLYFCLEWNEEKNKNHYWMKKECRGPGTFISSWRGWHFAICYDISATAWRRPARNTTRICSIVFYTAIIVNCLSKWLTKFTHIIYIIILLSYYITPWP